MPLSVPLKIALGDIRHRTVGRHSVLMPLGIAFLASYAKKKLGDAVDIRLYENPDIIFHDIKTWQPDILGLTNFMWNAELNRLVFKFAKEENPQIVCAGGGPEFPVERLECESYLQNRPEIDFFAYLEGEIAFTDLVGNFLEGLDLYTLKTNPPKGVLSIDPETRKINFKGPLPRIGNMDSIPSPYITGLMDQWFDGTYSPSVQTARGCPFTCGYCRASNKMYSRVVPFSVKRVKDELTHITRKMSAFPAMPLSIMDSNFGVLERDEEIAEHIRRLQDTYNWPNLILADTSKNNYNRVLRMADRLKSGMKVVCSLQSLNPETLGVIRRKNVPMDTYFRIQKELKDRGMVSDAEVILPLPEESRETFFDMIRKILDSGVKSIVSFTYMYLKGTALNRQEMRDQYGMTSAFRIIPRQFGEYQGKKCFEIEEVCPSTSTMPLEDYLDCRGFSFVSVLYADLQYDVIRRHLTELSISVYEFLYRLWKRLQDNNSKFSAIYREFYTETKDELWESPEAIYENFSQPEIYEKLLNGDVGDNLIRKYRAKVLSIGFVDSLDMAYDTLMEIAENRLSAEINESLNAAKEWMLQVRDISELFADESIVENKSVLNLPYDVAAWSSETDGTQFLWEYKIPTIYRLYYDISFVRGMLLQSRNLFGEDPDYRMGKVLSGWNSVDNFWKKCERIEEENEMCVNYN